MTLALCKIFDSWKLARYIHKSKYVAKKRMSTLCPNFEHSLWCSVKWKESNAEQCIDYITVSIF